jgi:hypothetical protein
MCHPHPHPPPSRGRGVAIILILSQLQSRGEQEEIMTTQTIDQIEMSLIIIPLLQHSITPNGLIVTRGINK